MEMTYNGTLTMPANFAALDEEEMTYVEGGLLSHDFGYECARNKWAASDKCNNWAQDILAFEVGLIALGAIIGGVAGSKGGLKGAVACAALGAMIGGAADIVLDQWRNAYAQAAYDARYLNWSTPTLIHRELIGGVMCINFFQAIYCG